LQNCYDDPQGLVFSDSPENWTTQTWQNQDAVILAQEETSQPSIYVDFYGLNLLSGQANLVVNVATSGTFEISLPGFRVSGDPNYATEGADASADFWNNQSNLLPPGQPAFSESVPSGDLITGEFEITSLTAPATISVEAFDGVCLQISCNPMPVPTDGKHSRGIFLRAVWVIDAAEIGDSSPTSAYFDMGTSTKGACGGPLTGYDLTQIPNLIPVYDDGDYGAIEEFNVPIKLDPFGSLDWYASPRGGEMTDAFAPGDFFENGSTEICPIAYAVPIGTGPITSGAIELGSEDQFIGFNDFGALVPGGSQTPIRYTYVQSSTRYTMNNCVTP